MLQLTGGTRSEGDFRTVDLEQAAGVAGRESSGVERVRETLAGLLASEALALGHQDDQLGPRCVTSRAV